MEQSPFSLENKTILVTGASSGIGKAIAQECAKAGARIVLTARNKERLEQTKRGLKGDRHLAITADLTDKNELKMLVSKIDKLDGVVFCAGVVKTLVMKQAEDSDVEHLFNTNILSVVHLSIMLIQQKKLNRESSIVFISSVSGVNCGYIGGGIYGATKAALLGYMKGLALEMAPRGIRVNAITPGMVESNILAESDISEEQIAEDKKKYPLYQRYGKPEEIGYAAVYLLSDATKWMTGSSILIDGGYTLL